MKGLNSGKLIMIADTVPFSYQSLMLFMHCMIFYFFFLFFSDLDENLQKAFLKYLEVRGVNPSLTNFLHEYMISKESKEYLEWLKNLKNFIEH